MACQRRRLNTAGCGTGVPGPAGVSHVARNSRIRPIYAPQGRRAPSEECIAPPLPKHLGYYPYSSTHTSKRPMYRSGATKPQSTSDYYNVMWDPHVYRGGTFQTFQDVEKERELANRKAQAKRTYKPRPILFGGIERPKTPPDISNRRKRVPVENFLEEHVDSVEEVNAGTQTDLIDPKPARSGPVVAKIGFDVSTGMECCELYDFDEEIEPIIETLADKVVEQSTLENLMEEDILDLRTRQNEYNDRRRQEQLEQHWLRVREMEVDEQQTELIQRYIQEIKEEKEMEERVCISQFSKSYLMNLIPQLLIGLENEGLISSALLEEIFQKIQPWLTTEVLEEIGQKTMSRDLLDEIIQGVVDDRKAEMAAGARAARQAEKLHKRDPTYVLPEYESEYEEE